MRYDERGCGLSDPELGDPSLETWVADLEAVVDAAGLDRFALLGISQGAAIAVAYAAGTPSASPTSSSTAATRAAGSSAASASRRTRWSRRSGPGGRPLTRPSATCSARCSFRTARPSRRPGTRICFDAPPPPRPRCGCSKRAARSTSATSRREVRARTLVVHARDDRVVPVEEGRLLAALIPDARLILLESANHILLADEPAWQLLRLRAARVPRHRRRRRVRRRRLRSQRARARGARAGRRRADQRGDRRAALHQRAHGRATPLEYLREAGRLGQGRRAPRPRPASRSCRSRRRLVAERGLGYV